MNRGRKTLFALVVALLMLALVPKRALAYDIGIRRIAGNNRFDTMANIVKSSFTTSDWAVVATGSNFPDALAASALAGAKRCPVILTPKEGLGSQARERLAALKVKNAYVVGGAAAVSAQAEKDLQGMGIATTRVQGANRLATSVEVLKTVAGESNTVIIATGKTFADALSIGPWSYASKSPVVLADSSGKLTDQEVQAIKAGGYTDYLIVGGANSVSPEVQNQLSGLKQRARLAGGNRYETSVAIAQWELGTAGMRNTRPAIATGQNFPDALAGAAFCGVANSPMVLVSGSNSSGLDWVGQNLLSTSSICVLGGVSAVDPYLYNALAYSLGAQLETGLINKGGNLYYYEEYGGMCTAGVVDDYVIFYDGTCHQVDRTVTGNQTADAQRVARVVAESVGPREGQSDLDRVWRAAYTVSRFCRQGRYTMEGALYRIPYGVFIAKEYSCAGGTRAMGMVLDFMGFGWSHVNENQRTHQWNVLTMDGQRGYVDGTNGFAGYGDFPGLDVLVSSGNPADRYVVRKDPIPLRITIMS